MGSRPRQGFLGGWIKMPSDHPSTWIGLAGVLIVVAGPIVTTLISSRRIVKAQAVHDKKIGAEVDLVKDQVLNNHGSSATNLREDLDRVIHTGEQSHELLLNTHKMLTDHNSHILRLGEKVNDHSNSIKEISKDVNDLHGRLNRVLPDQRTNKNKNIENASEDHDD